MHWPQDSCSKKRSAFKARSFAESNLENIITAADPIKQPYLLSVSKSRGILSNFAGNIPPEAPPGK